MIKKLQWKFVLIATMSLIIVLVLIIGGINLLNYASLNNELDSMIQYIGSNNGVIPDFDQKDLPDDDLVDNSKPDDKSPPQDQTMNDSSSSLSNLFTRLFGNSSNINAETKYKTRYFTVTVSEDGSFTGTDLDKIAAIDEDTAEEYASQVIESGKTSGFLSVYKYGVIDNNGEKLLVFIDGSEDISSARVLLLISLLIFIVSILVMFILVYFLSKRAIRPVNEAIEKQRQFITDASHELKTPLSIISADADVIKMTSKEEDYKWIDNIKKQVVRMNLLVKDLITLSKLDEINSCENVSTFNISSVANDLIDQLTEYASEKGKSFVPDIEKNLIIKGDEESLKKLMSILIDNAIKYSTNDYDIEFSLKRRNSGFEIKTTNGCEGVSKQDTEKIFDRFYRSDKSRSRETGGYGIGLSIAKEIVLLHKGHITASLDGDKMTIIAYIKNIA